MSAVPPVTTGTDWFSLGVQLRARREPDGTRWTHCDECRWSAVAGSWDELFRLTSEFHRSPEAKHQGWVLWGDTWTATDVTTAGT
jgi:hypothetical protein